VSGSTLDKFFCMTSFGERHGPVIGYVAPAPPGDTEKQQG
jgi:chorismate synthase